MTVFQIGDKVRCDDNSHVEKYLTVGKTYVVTQEFNNGLITLVDDLGEACKYLPERFTKVDHGDFQIGDKVQYTGSAGTVTTGEIWQITEMHGYSEDGAVLYNSKYPERTVLLDRPEKLKKDVGTMYRIKESGGLYVAVKMPDSLWMCSLPLTDCRWISDYEMAELMDSGEWEEWA